MGLGVILGPEGESTSMGGSWRDAQLVVSESTSMRTSSWLGCLLSDSAAADFLRLGVVRLGRARPEILASLFAWVVESILEAAARDVVAATRAGSI